jgi:hypothetical protein
VLQGSQHIRLIRIHLSPLSLAILLVGLWRRHSVGIAADKSDGRDSSFCLIFIILLVFLGFFTSCATFGHLSLPLSRSTRPPYPARVRTTDWQNTSCPPPPAAHNTSHPSHSPPYSSFNPSLWNHVPAACNLSCSLCHAVNLTYRSRDLLPGHPRICQYRNHPSSQPR